MKGPLDFLQIHRELCGDASDRRLDDRHVFLLLDRGMSPAGSRCLRNQRCTGPRAWPNPGVYSIPEAAERILIELERLQQRRLRPRKNFSRLAQIVTLLEAPFPRPALSVREAHFLIEESRVLRKIGLPRASWAEIVRELEQNEEPELQTWSERILAHAFLEAEAERRGAALSEWSAVESAIRGLEELPEGTPFPWGLVFERPPGTTKSELIVPALPEPFPLERRFLRALHRHLPVHAVKATNNESAPKAKDLAQSLPLLDLGRADAPEKIAIHWAFPHDLPTSTEAAELLPGDFAIDHVEPPRKKGLERDRSLYLFCDYLDEGRPPSHLFLRGDSPRLRVRDAGFDPETEVSASQILRRLASASEGLAREFRDAARDGLDSLIDGRGTRADWMKTIVGWDCLDDDDDASAEEPRHSRLSPIGASFLSLGDFGLTGHARICLWTDREHLVETLDPLSAETLKKKIFPSKLQSLVEAQGMPLPDPGREAQSLAAAIRALEGRIFLLRGTQVAPRKEIDSFRIQARVAPDRLLSPSGIEAYLKCPLRFYLERELRFSPTEEWDSTSEYALLTGSWVHKCLERFFDRPEWDEPRARLLALLLETRDEFFGLVATPSYTRLLEARAETLAQALAAHVLNFEKPLSRLRTLTPERETEVRGEFAGASLKGRVDRVDSLPSGVRLLWDYKSGKVQPKNPIKQAAKGRVQWFLYRELLESAPIAGGPIVGGGYLNPLRPEDSSLFLIVPGNPHLSELTQIFEAAGHPVEFIDADATDLVRTAFRERVEAAVRGIRAGEFPAHPENETDCYRCDQQSLCGRPFLREERDE